MPLLSLCDADGARHDIRKCRLVIDYVNLVKADVLLKANGEITLAKRCKPAMAKIQYGTHVSVQSEERAELPLFQNDKASLLRSECQPIMTSIPPCKRSHNTLEPDHIDIISLPPSSPLTSFLEGSEAIAPPEEDMHNSDPFGFLAAENKLKVQRPCCLLMTSYSGRVLEKHSPHGEGVSRREAFATSCEASFAVNKHEVSAPVEHRKRIAVSVSESSSASLQTDRLDASSPCRKAMKHRSTTLREVLEEVENVKNEDREHKWKAATFQLEALPLLAERLKGGIRRSRGRKREMSKTSTKRGTRQLPSESALLSHLTGEERKKFENEREERIAYYRRLDEYHVAKETVWMV